MTCASLLLFAAAYASFTIVPQRTPEPAVPSGATYAAAIINAPNNSQIRANLVNGAPPTPTPTPNATLKSNSLRFDLTFVASGVAYSAVVWSGLCARCIIDSIVFAVALAAHIAGRRLYGWAHAIGALSAMVFSILLGSFLERTQSTSASELSNRLSSNDSGIAHANGSGMAFVSHSTGSGMKEMPVEQRSGLVMTSDYMFRFDIVVACGCVALLLNILSVSFYRTAPRRKQKGVLKDIWNAIRNAHVASIFVVIFITGFLSHSNDGLYYWYIQDLGGSTFFVGLILGLRRLVEIVGNLVGPSIVARIGSKPAFLIVFAAYVIRFTGLALLPYTAHIHVSLGPLGPARPAYWVLPFELLHAVTFSFDRLVYSSELSAHSPASSISSLVAIGQACQLGLGFGLVALCQGAAYSTIGPQAFYALLIGVALISGVLYALFQYCFLSCWTRHQKRKEAENVQIARDGEELKTFEDSSTREL